MPASTDESSGMVNIIFYVCTYTILRHFCILFSQNSIVRAFFSPTETHRNSHVYFALTLAPFPSVILSVFDFSFLLKCVFLNVFHTHTAKFICAYMYTVWCMENHAEQSSFGKSFCVLRVSLCVCMFTIYDSHGT